MFAQRRSSSADKFHGAAADAAFASASALPGSLDAEFDQRMLEEQLRVQASLARWSGRQGLEVPTGALMRQMQPVPPAPARECTIAKKLLPTTSLRADAPSFTPGADQFKVSYKKRAPRQDETAVMTPNNMGEADLPAVISVKKSSRGFAVVLIRDQAVIERGVAQSVAVVDGVCVEVKRHTPKRNDDEEEERGLFIACGAKVASKVTITVEGIEAYFNALATAPCPQSLEVQRPFEEGCVSFPLRSTGKLLPLILAASMDRPEQDRLLGGEFCRTELVESLWEQKARLDDLWKLNPPPLARNVVTRVARAQLFPHSGEGGKEHENRAGDKLAELSNLVGLLGGVPQGAAFLDLCGGPGAWSQHLLAQGALHLRGFGFTLRTDVGAAEDWQAQEKDQWYPELFRDSRWKALWGADGTGDLLKPGNVEHCATQLMKENGCFLCVADGGFSDKAIPPNRLELYFYRLFLGELLMAVSCLQKGGRFVCKMYTTCSPATGALLYLTTRLFERVSIVKPMSSRVTGPERYLAAFGFRGNANSEVATIRATLTRMHDFCGGASCLTSPLLAPIISAEDLARDKAFSQTCRAMAEGLCERQASALRAVVDRHVQLEDMAMAVARSAGTVERASYEKVDKDRADYEKYKQRREGRFEGSPANSDVAQAMSPAAWEAPSRTHRQQYGGRRGGRDAAQSRRCNQEGTGARRCGQGAW